MKQLLTAELVLIEDEYFTIGPKKNRRWIFLYPVCGFDELANPLSCDYPIKPLTLWWNVIDSAVDAGLAGAVGAAEIIFLGFDPVADHLAAAVSANGSQFVDRTFEAIEGVFDSGSDDVE